MWKYLSGLMAVVALNATPERYQSQPSKMAKVRESIRFAKKHPDQSNLVGCCCGCLHIAQIAVAVWLGNR